MKPINPVPPSPNAETNNSTTTDVKNALSRVSDGLGYILMWSSSAFRLTSSDLQQRATDANLPQEIVDSIVPHTVTASVGLAISDTRWKRVKFNKRKIEANVLHVDQNGTQTIEFLGYSKIGDDGNAEGKRSQLDKVVIDNQGNWMHRGNSSEDFADTFISIVDHHLSHLGGNDVYEKVTRPVLKQLRSYRITRNNYYVAQTSENNDLINSLENFFGSIGYELVCLTQAMDGRTRDGLSNRASRDLQGRLDDVHKKIGDWKSQNRVHGRSQETVITRLGEIMTDAEGLESALGTDLKSLRDAITAAKQEALGIINSQAPAGVAPAVYSTIKAMLTDDRIMQKTDHGNVYLFKQELFKDFIKGNAFTAQADRATAALGYYSYVAQGLVILRPRAELSV
tara:strand:- start:907 stop:2097 length:1191 start_codon:yes stop_codon:yes gene_type:complete